ncbi:MAG: tryptophan synthase subunit alpha [Candidatus Gracilibacteria bacterium]|nr:tryptophan synthase subunit alpha [Candidatus Gracilibacteria bacterium]
MTHMVCGYPNISESEEIFKTLSKYSEYLEVQFPFSDPIADGPIIEKANEIALVNGITTEKCFDFIVTNSPLPQGRGARGEGPKILIMTYYNILLNYGVEKFIKKAKSVGVYGFIIPDIPFDEEDGKTIRELCKKYNIVFTELISPITTNSRLKEIKKLNPELIYAISQNMTTGSKSEFGDKFRKYIINLKKIFNTGQNIGVGFGVKTKIDVEKVCEISDFAIIGSEFIKKLEFLMNGRSGKIFKRNN